MKLLNKFVLVTIIWIDESLKQILTKNIHRCFKKANFSLDSDELEELNQNENILSELQISMNGGAFVNY